MISYPEVAINSYVWEQFRLDSLKSASASYLEGFDYNAYGGITPFFPVDDATAGTKSWGNKTYVRFDSMTRNRAGVTRGLYPVKGGQMIYSIKGPVDEVFKWRDFISNILDREDIVAMEINEWAGQNLDKYYTWFHNIATMQSNAMNQTTTDTTQRKLYSADLVIRYDYHITNVYSP